MARCKRCGAVFDYDKKEGVCPRCCFYNRPPGSPHHDDEWLSTYNIEDNTFQLPKQSYQLDEEPESSWFKRRSLYKKKYSSKKDCDTEGSHIHTRPKAKTREDYKKREEPPENKGLRRFLTILVIFIVILCFVSFVIPVLRARFTRPVKEPAPVEEFKVEKMSADDLIKGVQIGDMTFSTMGQGAIVLFKEGELPEIPPGEVCIGIPLADNESSLHYNGIYWKRPYVFDGSHYRELVNGNLLSGKGLDQKMGIDFMKEFVSSTKDFDGLAIYFIDKDAEKVTLCIPNQTLDGDKVLCSGVVEIDLPVTRIQQEGGMTGE